MSVSRIIWDMGTLPFHMGPLPSPRVEGFPERLPFRVGYDDTIGLFTQVFDERIMNALHEVYARGSQLGIPMGDHGLGKAYADDFEGVIREWSGAGLAGSDVLEIGCGTGHLLSALADTGARAFGVEPDPRCAEAMSERGIPVATCELEEFEPEGAFDTVVHYCVWEHAPDPVGFLARQKALLKPGGRIVCAVPDCTEPLESGDISIFIHQHWSYFSAASLRRAAAAAGFRVQEVRGAKVGGVLYACLVDEAPDGRAVDAEQPAHADARQPANADAKRPAGADAEQPAAEAKRHAGAEAEALVERCRRATARFVDYVHRLSRDGRSLGIYCPARAINYVPAGDELVASPRLFDDSPLLLDKFMPPFRSPVEGGSGLESGSVDELLVMSRSFGETIETAVRARHLSPEPRVRHIDELLAHD